MSYCYAEKTRDGKIKHLVFQDETGIYSCFFDNEHENARLVTTHSLQRTSIKMPGEKPKTVMTNTKEFLEFVRQCERGSYTQTMATEIREYEGSREEVVKLAIKDFSQMQ